jgi:SAM-dependent methyltransferase
LDAAPTPLLVETAATLAPGKALDLACGAGRNALWLAEHGWEVTAVDGAQAAIEILRTRATERGLKINALVADLEKGEFDIELSQWDLVVMCYYLQRNLFEPAKRGVAPGGILISIVHLTEPGEENGRHRLGPGELEQYFETIPRKTDDTTMPKDNRKSGLAVISSTIPSTSAIRMFIEKIRKGSRSLPRISDSFGLLAAQASWIARMRLPVTAPSGAIRRRAPNATLGQASVHPDI